MNDDSPQLYYRISYGTYNTGEPYRKLEFLTHCGLWHGSTVQDIDSFIAERLVAIQH